MKFASYSNGWRQYQRGHREIPHASKREVERRLRQAERDAQRQWNRVDCGRTYYLNGEQVRPERISRRGRILA